MQVVQSTDDTAEAVLATIKVEDVTVRFGNSTVLDAVSFEVADGELCVLVGPSGCGKTLTLRVIAGLTRPARGHIYMDGQRVDDVPPGDRDVAMCFQTYALYPYMTVRENWSFPLQAAHLPDDEVRRRVDAVTHLLHMELLMHRYPRELSGGQQQRVALGRALVRRPRVYLLDEPFGNLDAKLRVEMRAELKKLQMDLGITTVHVTHDQVEAQALGDKIVVMDVGTVQQVGTPEGIYEEPANLFVAGFIGVPAMNFIEGTLARRNGTLHVRHPRFELALPPVKAARAEAWQGEGTVVMGVRPESVRLSPREGEGVPTEVYVLEPQSNEVIVDLKFDDMILKVRSVQERLDFHPQINQRVYMAFDSEQIHLFDKATGKRIG
jgi:ABC-type sugar transport system ATPase subunit